MSPAQIVLALVFAAACAYTVVGYPRRYGALSGRSRLFRSVGLFLLDLLLGLALLGTLVDFTDPERPRMALLRFIAYVLACLFLFLSVICIAVLDWLESLVAYRRAHRDILYRTAHEEREKEEDSAGGAAPVSDGAEDALFLRRALQLARRGRTHPNPMVGAVVVHEGRIVGEGFHVRKGEPHAEAMAFAAAGDRARGATLYVTLEPCSFTDGGRTPCALRCLHAGVARVVAAMTDPDARVSGRGFAQLRAAGVAVTVGVEERAAHALNAPYIKHRKTGLPYVTHKAAMTLDGKIAARTGDSRWVTGEAARAYVHRLRDRADAVVVGANTVCRDDPLLTTRLPRGNGHDPLRVLIDSALRIPPEARAIRAAHASSAGTLVATLVGTDPVRRRGLEAAGAEVVELPPDAAGGVDVAALAQLLADRGALSVLLEGGGEIAAAFWEAGLVDRALFFVAPKILGGRDAKTPIEGAGRATMQAAIRLKSLRVRRWGDDIALEGEVET